MSGEEMLKEQEASLRRDLRRILTEVAEMATSIGSDDPIAKIQDALTELAGEVASAQEKCSYIRGYRDAHERGWLDCARAASGKAEG